jgi:hypothetical protein
LSNARARVVLVQSTDGYTPSAFPFVPLNGFQPANTATFYSVPINVDGLDTYRYVFATPAGSTLVGTVQLQATVDEVGSLTGTPNAADLPAADWVPLSFSVNGAAFANSFAVASGANQIALDEAACTYAWLRMLFTFASGSGSPTCKLRGKGIQGR